MYQSLAVFETASQMARHAGRRQALTAKNIANADTPGYRATHIAEFKETFGQSQRISMQASRPAHIVQSSAVSGPRPSQTPTEASPNGNSVSLEEEMLSAVEIAREHNRALTIYRHALTVLRTSLGR